jgi:hypothetical protein
MGNVEVADLSEPAQLARVGLDPPHPGRRMWPPYQAVGETLWREQWGGLLAPSAARPSGLVLCLFVDEPAVLLARPIPPPRVVAEPPAPPIGLRT